ncbi:MAG: PKD domain-containing protein, partial [Thermoplasmata archaeon]
IVLYALYLSFILFSSVHYLADQDVTRGTLIDGEYKSHLAFPEDGEYGHYKSVILDNKNYDGKIELKYVFETNTLFIQRVENIKELVIDCKLMYENKCKEVFEKAPSLLESDYYKTYFRETNNGLFTVVINTDTPMEKMQFVDIPIPKRVLVDNRDWWETETSYYSLDENDITITYIPKGSTTVHIFFDEIIGKNPIAFFTADKYVVLLNDEINFDASGSSDEDGQILHYLWEFGDDTEFSGKFATHTYNKLGPYDVTLTVRDNDYLEDTYTKTIFVVESGVDSDDDGVTDEYDPNPFSNIDSDLDGLSDDYEDVISKTNKTLSDSDGDGWDDKYELEQGFDPNNNKSHPTEKKKAEEEKISSVLIIIILIVVVFIILIGFIFMRKQKKEGEPPAVVEPPKVIRTEVEKEPVKPDTIIRRPPDIQEMPKLGISKEVAIREMIKPPEVAEPEEELPPVSYVQSPEPEEGPVPSEEEQSPEPEEGPVLSEEEQSPEPEEGPVLSEEEQSPEPEEGPVFSEEEQSPEPEEGPVFSEEEQSPEPEESPAPSEEKDDDTIIMKPATVYEDPATHEKVIVRYPKGFKPPDR